MMRTPFLFPRASSSVLNKVLFQWIRWSCNRTRRLFERPLLWTGVENRPRGHQLGLTEGSCVKLNWTGIEEVWRRQNFYPKTGHIWPEHISVIIRQKKVMRCLRLYHDIISELYIQWTVSLIVSQCCNLMAFILGFEKYQCKFIYEPLISKTLCETMLKKKSTGLLLGSSNPKD